MIISTIISQNSAESLKRKVRTLVEKPVSFCNKFYYIRIFRCNLHEKDDLGLCDKLEDMVEPILTHFSNDDLKMYIDKRDRKYIILFAEFPCHTQITKKCGKHERTCSCSGRQFVVQLPGMHS